MIYLPSPGDVEITVNVNEYVLFAKLKGKKKNRLFVRESSQCRVITQWN